MVADPARAAYQRKEYRAAIEALDNFPMANLPQRYKDLPGLYQEACYLYAEELYHDGKPYEALPYYQRIADYKDVADKKLERRCYLILGVWKSIAGKEARFQPDGTCNLMREELSFSVDNYTLLTGTDRENLTPTHRVTSVTRTSLTIRDTRNGQSAVYKFDRDETSPVQFVTPAPKMTPAPAPTANDLDEMLVQEDDDAAPGP